MYKKYSYIANLGAKKGGKSESNLWTGIHFMYEEGVVSIIIRYLTNDLYKVFE